MKTSMLLLIYLFIYLFIFTIHCGYQAVTNKINALNKTKIKIVFFNFFSNFTVPERFVYSVGKLFVIAEEAILTCTWNQYMFVTKT